MVVAALYGRQTMSELETCSKKGRFVVGGGRCPLVTAVAAVRTGGILAVTNRQPFVQQQNRQIRSLMLQVAIAGATLR